MTLIETLEQITLGTLVLHMDSHTIGVVEHVYGPGEYESISSPTVKLHTGDVFVFKPDAFIGIGGKDNAEAFRKYEAHCKAWLDALVKVAPQFGVDDRAMASIVLRQAMRLSVSTTRVPPGVPVR